MNIHEWCIAVLKGKVSYRKCSELYNLCTKHYRERVFDSEDEMFAALEPFKEYFCFKDYLYDYVTFDDDGQKDSLILELAKDVLRSHSNRYTLSVLCRKMKESGNVDDTLDDASLKEILSSRRCFTIERRSIKMIELSTKGEEYNIEPIVLGRPPKTEEDKKREIEQKLKKKLAKEQERLLRKALKEEERERKRILKEKKAEHKKDLRIEKIRMIISYYHITDETTLEQLWVDKLIRKIEYVKCADWRLYNVGDVYNWVESHNLPEHMDNYRKRSVLRLLKIVSFHNPELARLIPNVKFSGIRKANRVIKLSKQKAEMDNNTIEVKIGDVLRWNYTKDEGEVIGFNSEDGTQEIVIRNFDGEKLYFENDSKLFTILEGEEREKVINKRNEFLEKQKDEEKVTSEKIKKTKKAPAICEGVLYDAPTRRGSKLKRGDKIRFKLTNEIGMVRGFIREGGLDRIIISGNNGMPNTIIDNTNAYEIVKSVED